VAHPRAAPRRSHGLLVVVGDVSLSSATTMALSPPAVPLSSTRLSALAARAQALGCAGPGSEVGELLSAVRQAAADLGCLRRLKQLQQEPCTGSSNADGSERGSDLRSGGEGGGGARLASDQAAMQRQAAALWDEATSLMRADKPHEAFIAFSRLQGMVPLLEGGESAAAAAAGGFHSGGADGRFPGLASALQAAAAAALEHRQRHRAASEQAPPDAPHPNTHKPGMSRYTPSGPGGAGNNCHVPTQPNTLSQQLQDACSVLGVDSQMVLRAMAAMGEERAAASPGHSAAHQSGSRATVATARAPAAVAALAAVRRAYLRAAATLHPDSHRRHGGTVGTSATRPLGGANGSTPCAPDLVSGSKQQLAPTSGDATEAATAELRTLQPGSSRGSGDAFVVALHAYHCLTHALESGTM
jgi:hypothetical protein